MRIALLIFLSVFACRAQLPVVQLPQFVLSSVPPSPPSNVDNTIEFWWVSSDMATNITVTNWIDRIRSSTWTNISTATTCPTNSSSGVHFLASNSQRLTNSTAVPINTSGSTDTNSWWIIINMDTVNTSPDWLSQTPTGPGSPTMGHLSGSPYTYDGTTLAQDGNISAGHYVDVCLTSTSGSGHSAPHNVTFYTNGIPSNTNTLTSIATSVQLKCLGGDTVNGFYNGYIVELAVYSNTLSSVTVSNLHRYATNLYKFTP